MQPLRIVGAGTAGLGTACGETYAKPTHGEAGVPFKGENMSDPLGGVPAPGRAPGCNGIRRVNALYSFGGSDILLHFSTATIFASTLWLDLPYLSILIYGPLA